MRIFGEGPIYQLFSRSWQERENGIIQVKEQFKVTDYNENFLAALKVVKYTIKDKIVGVVQAAMMLLQRICKSNPKLSPDQGQDTQRLGANFMKYLIEKLGDNLIKTRQFAIETIFQMSRCDSAFGARLIVPILVQSEKSGGNGNK